MFEGFYSGATARVLLKGRYGRQFTYNVGVRQGSRWSPDLGAFYVEDVIVILKVHASGARLGEEDIVCIFYADDLIIFESDPILLQKVLDVLQKECFRVGLDVNVSKTVYTTFTSQKRRNVKPLFFKGAPIKFEPNGVVYLGGHLDRQGSMKPHLKDRAAKSQRALGATMQIWARYGNMTISFRLELLNSLVCSVLQYASEIWGWGKTDILERVEAKALRIALKLGDKVSVSAIRWLMGRHPLAVRFWINAYTFWSLVAGMPDERFEKQALNAVWDLYLKHRTGWVKEMVDIFIKIKFIRDEQEAILLKGWTKEQIVRKLNEFKEAAYRYWEQEIWIQLSAEN